ncbi:hypothetical protein BH11PAT1_BH11PAT1_3670 [soil metagenome]
MKGLLRNIAIYAISLYLLPKVISGVQTSGSINTFLIGGVVLTLLHMLIKPLLNILSFPFNIGVLTTLTNVLLLYLLTVFVPDIRVVPFTSHQLNLGGFIVPSMHFNAFFAFITATLLLSLIVFAIEWIRD